MPRESVLLRNPAPHGIFAKSRNVLESWVYIGANEYLGCYKHSVFPSVVDKAIFFEAQAKMARKQIDLQ